MSATDSPATSATEVPAAPLPAVETAASAKAAKPVKAAKAEKPAKPAKQPVDKAGTMAPKPAAKAAKPLKAAKPVKTPKAPEPPVAAKPLARGTKKPVATAAAPAADKAPRVKEAPKEKLVRDSFTMPRADFALIAQLKDRALVFQRPTKKSELLRAGLHALSALGDDALRALLEQLPTLKTGRPRKAA